MSKRTTRKKTQKTLLVDVHSITPPAFFRRILQDLETAGFHAPFLYGGALRDVAMGRTNEINDLDIDMPFHESMKDIEFNNQNVNQFIKNCFKHLGTIPNIDKMEFHRTVREPRGPHNRSKKSLDPIALRIDLYAYGHIVALFIVPPGKKRLANKALKADAPINSIYMSSNGQIVAHHDFEDHAKRRVFKALTQNQPLRRLFNRYTHLADKIDGLNYDGPKYNPANDNKGSRRHKGHNTQAQRQGKRDKTVKKRQAYKNAHRPR